VIIFSIVTVRSITIYPVIKNKNGLLKKRPDSLTPAKLRAFEKL
jgi:hypothetical protein